MTIIFAPEVKKFEDKSGGYFKLCKDVYLSNEDKFISSGELIRIEDVRVRNDGISNWSSYDNYRVEMKINNLDFGLQEINLTIYDVKNISDIDNYFKTIFGQI